MKSIGKILQYYRKQNNMTQSDLAAKMSEYGCPIKNGAISTWEKDYCNINYTSTGNVDTIEYNTNYINVFIEKAA